MQPGYCNTWHSRWLSAIANCADRGGDRFGWPISKYQSSNAPNDRSDIRRFDSCARRRAFRPSTGIVPCKGGISTIVVVEALPPLAQSPGFTPANGRVPFARENRRMFLSVIVHRNYFKPWATSPPGWQYLPLVLALTCFARREIPLTRDFMTCRLAPIGMTGETHFPVDSVLSYRLYDFVIYPYGHSVDVCWICNELLWIIFRKACQMNPAYPGLPPAFENSGKEE